MDMAAEKSLGLMAVDKVADRPAAAVDAIPNAIERGIERRRVADQDQRVQLFKRRQARSEFVFTVLAGSLEGRGAGVAESRDMILANGQCLPVKVAEAELTAEARDLAFGFVIPRQDVNTIGALGQNLSASLEPAAPVHQVAGREVVVGLHGHELFQRPVIAVDVGKDKEPHEKEGARCQHLEPKT